MRNLRLDPPRRKVRRTRWSRTMTRDAFRPGIPITPPPGCVPDPHRYSPRSGVR